MYIDEKYYCSKCLRLIEEENICPYCGYDHSSAGHMSNELEPGALLKERYQIGAVIGKGSFGITYAAWDEALNIPVAIKEFYPGGIVTRNTEYAYEVMVPENLMRQYLVCLDHFIRESRVLAMLKDMPGVVRVQDYFEENNTAYIVMEYIRGITLKEYIQKEKISVRDFLVMLENPVKALIVLHKNGVIHRDITPSNMMIQEDGCVKLIDFGAAAIIKREQTIMTRTNHYAPVEQYMTEDMPVGTWSDVYGLSATIYEALTGIVPQEAVSRMHKDELVPIEKTGIKLKKYQAKALTAGLMVDPEKRTQTMEEFHARLYHLLLPEEVRQRKKYMRRMGTIFGVGFSLTMLVLLNDTTGFPLGQGLVYCLRLNGFHIVNSLSIKEEVAIPSSKIGIPVAGIDEDAFNNNQLKKIVIPGSVKTIESMAFYSCENLENIVLQEGVEKIGEYAFAECGSLRSIYLPDSIKEMAENCCEGNSVYLTVWGNEDSYCAGAAKEACLNFAAKSEYEYQTGEDDTANLKAYKGAAETIVLPSVIDGIPVMNLKENEEGRFEISPQVTSVTLPEKMDVIPQYSFAGETYNEEVGNVKECIPGKYVTSIGDCAFMRSALEKIELPQGLEKIGRFSFAETKLETIEIPDSVTTIDTGAFAGSSLKKIALPASVSEWGNMIFGDCKNLKEVVLPANITEIEWYMFSGCSSLEEISLPENVTKICDGAFSNCGALEYLEVPEGVTRIGDYAFENCRNLKYIDIPESVTEISSTAFDGCSSDLYIGGFSGSYAEKYAKNQKMQFENKNQWETAVEYLEDGSLNIGETADYNLILPAYNMQDHTLVRKVSGTMALGPIDREQSVLDDRELSIRFPVCAEEIGMQAFYAGQIHVGKVDFPKTLRIIGEEAFYGNDSLLEVNFSEGLERINRGAFYGCENLDGIILPDSLVVLEESAFSITGLTSIQLSKGLTSLSDDVFSYSQLEGLLTIPGNIKKCGSSFRGCQNLQAVIAEEGVLELKETFEGCSSLETVEIPESMNYVAEGTFKDCINLTSVFVRGMDTVLDEKAFEGCSNVILYCYEGAAAEEYAEEMGIPYEIMND